MAPPRLPSPLSTILRPSHRSQSLCLFPSESSQVRLSSPADLSPTSRLHRLSIRPSRPTRSHHLRLLLVRLRQRNPLIARKHHNVHLHQQPVLQHLVHHHHPVQLPRSRHTRNPRSRLTDHRLLSHSTSLLRSARNTSPNQPRLRTVRLLNLSTGPSLLSQSNNNSSTDLQRPPSRPTPLTMWLCPTTPPPLMSSLPPPSLRTLPGLNLSRICLRSPASMCSARRIS